MAYFTAEWVVAGEQIANIRAVTSVQSDAAIIEATGTAGSGDVDCPYDTVKAFCVVKVDSAATEVVLVRLNADPVAGGAGSHAVWPGGSSAFYASPGDTLHYLAVTIPS